jgi:hypothetical protein
MNRVDIDLTYTTDTPRKRTSARRRGVNPVFGASRTLR